MPRQNPCTVRAGRASCPDGGGHCEILAQTVTPMPRCAGADGNPWLVSLRAREAWIPTCVGMTISGTVCGSKLIPLVENPIRRERKPTPPPASGYTVQAPFATPAQITSEYPLRREHGPTPPPAAPREPPAQRPLKSRRKTPYAVRAGRPRGRPPAPPRDPPPRNVQSNRGGKPHTR